MSNIALIMNLSLGGLLLVALMLGWRLERRLKALRDSHKSFALAVGDLDRAAARAEQGLADLRAATDEAAETLAIRIERATALAANLERLSNDAGLVEERLTSARAAAPSGPPAPIQAARDAATRFAERYLAASREAPRPANVRTDLILDDEDEAPSTVTRFAPPRAEPPLHDRSALERARSRSMVDDDLFEEPAPRRVGLGANR